MLTEYKRKERAEEKRQQQQQNLKKRSGQKCSWRTNIKYHRVQQVQATTLVRKSERLNHIVYEEKIDVETISAKRNFLFGKTYA